MRGRLGLAVIAALIASAASVPIVTTAAHAATDPPLVLASTGNQVLLTRAPRGDYLVYGVFEGQTLIVRSHRASDGRVVELWRGTDAFANPILVADAGDGPVALIQRTGVTAYPLDGQAPIELTPGGSTRARVAAISDDFSTIVLRTPFSPTHDDLWVVAPHGPKPAAPVGRQDHTAVPLFGLVGKVHVSPDGKFVAWIDVSTSAPGPLRVVAATGGPPIDVDGQVAEITDLGYGNQFLYTRTIGAGPAVDIRLATFGSAQTRSLAASPTFTRPNVSFGNPAANAAAVSVGGTTRVIALDGRFDTWESPVANVGFVGTRLLQIRTETTQPGGFPVQHFISSVPIGGGVETDLGTSERGVASPPPFPEVTHAGDILIRFTATGAEPARLELQRSTGGGRTTLFTAAPGQNFTSAIDESGDWVYIQSGPFVPVRAISLRTGEAFVVGPIKGQPEAVVTLGDRLIVLDLFYNSYMARYEREIVSFKLNRAAPIRSLDPARLLDSRGPGLTIDGLHSGGGVLIPGSTTDLLVAGRGGIPDDVESVAVNVTVTDARAAGYLTVFPCGQPPPNASNLNFDGGETIPNLAIVKVGVGGRVCFYASAAVHLIVDVSGFIPTASGFDPVSPSRLLDSRAPGLTIDGESSGAGALAAGSVTELRVAGRAGIPSTAAAAALNITVTGVRGNGYLTVFPCGTNPPNASNLNFVDGDTIANMVLARLGAGGRVCIFTSATTHVIVDANGSLADGAGYGSLAPARLADSRAPGLTIDGESSGMGVLPAGSTTEVRVAGRAGAPSDAAAAVLNVTATGAAADGYLTVFPCGQPVPNASNLNFNAGQTIPNAVLAKLGAGGKVCIFASSGTHLIVDVNGWVAAG